MRTDIQIFKGDSMPQLPHEDTTELYINEIFNDCSVFLQKCGDTLRRCSKLSVRSFTITNLNFLSHFTELEEISVSLSKLSDLDGLEAQTKIRSLSIGESLSSKGSLSPIGFCRDLVYLGLSGPFPYRDIAEVGGLEKIETISLYKPKWPIAHLVRLAPNVKAAKILHCQAESLDFMLSLPYLSELELAYFRKLTEIKPSLIQKLTRLELSHSKINIKKGA